MSIIKSAVLYMQARPIEEILISIYIISLVSEYLIAKITKTKIHHLKETIANFVIGFFSFIIYHRLLIYYYHTACALVSI